MDRRSLELLEYPRVAADVARHADTVAGARRLAEWTPIAGAEARAEEVAMLAEAIRRTREPGGWLAVGAGALDETVGGDARDLDPLDLLEARGWLDAAHETADAWRDPESAARHPGLAARVEALPRLDALRVRLHESLEPDGRVADGASPVLRRARAEHANGERDVQQRLEKWSRGFGESAYVTRQGDRFVALVPAAGFPRRRAIVHDVSGSGQSLFVEPIEMTDANNRLLELKAVAVDEERRVLRELATAVAAAAAELLRLHEILVHLDTLRARARWAIARDAIALRPGGDRLRLVHARHPLLVAAGADVVPLDLELERGAPFLLVTGPNMGGKTVLLKTVGLAALLAHAAFPVTAAEGSRVPELDHVEADLGDAQSLDQGLSTFAAHLRAMDRMAQVAGPRALLLADELGAGTDPEEGAPLGRALVERFAARGAWGIVTTHLGALKLLAGTVPGVVNGSLEIDAATMRPTYRFVPGVPGASHALAIAERLGLDPAIVAQARANVRAESATLERVLQDLQTLRRALDAERAAAAEARAAAADAERRHREAAENAKVELDRVTRKLTRESEALVARSRELWQTVQREARRAEKSRGDAAALKQAIAGVEGGIEALGREGREAYGALGVSDRGAAGRPLTAADLAPGLKVRVSDLGMEAEVVEAPDAEGNVRLKRGSWTIQSHVGKLERLAEPDAGAAAAARARQSAPAATWERDSAPLDVDLRGREVDDALRELDRALDQGVVGGMQELRIIHGIGKGVLRVAVERHLKGHPQVASLRMGQVGEGGRGVTVARLR